MAGPESHAQAPTVPCVATWQSPRVAGQLIASKTNYAGKVVVFSGELYACSLGQTKGGLTAPFWTPSGTQAEEALESLADYAVRRKLYPAYKTKEAFKRAFAFQAVGETWKQYFSGAPIILINGACRVYADWPSAWSFTQGGGSCFFKAWYDPKRRRIIRVDFNTEV